MAVLGTSWAQTHPSRIEPGVLMNINQASGFQELLATGAPRILIDPEDLYVYIRTLAMRGQAATNQNAANLLPGATLIPGYRSTPTYRIRAHAEWDHHDAANMSRWGVNIAEGYRRANRQTIFQTLRNLALFGFNSNLSEGLLNTPGATAVNLPPDSFGDVSVRTYDNGAMAIFLLSVIQQMKNRTFQWGIPHRFVFLGPQRVISQFETINIVQVTSYQRVGAGTATTAQVVEQVLKETQGDAIEWAYDDTLIGQGQGGTDAIICIMPEVKQPTGPEWDTNEFAKLEPNLAATTLMYADMPAPLEITVPLPLGAVDTLYEIRATPGWCIRPDAETIISLQY